MQKKVYDIIKNKREWLGVALHVLIWLIVFLIPYIFTADMSGGHHREDNGHQGFLQLNTAMNCCWILLFYFNAWVLLPRLVYKRKTAVYVLALAGIFCLVVLMDSLFFHLFIHQLGFSFYHSLGHNFIPFAFILAVSAAYKAISDKTKGDILISQKQSEHLKTELSFLRSQISPHFLFNVLNNIAALARIKSDDLEPTVMKLSSLMRYMLYETDEDKVIVKNEVEYLQDYIDLQKQRFGDELNLKVTLDIREEWHTIEPMLLIPFVENAFKHGGGLVLNPKIQISLSVDKDRLHFSVQNKFEETMAVKDKSSGIGLANVQRRLELLYPNKHVLKLENKEGMFKIYLELILK